MCGSTEIDGLAFHLGLEAYPGFLNPIRPVTYLMKQSIFRPNYEIDPSGKVSLGIRPLSELIDMYHAHEATDRRDKVFALLGMSSDSPTTLQDAGLSPDYNVPWEELLRRLIKFFLGDQALVYTWPNRETATIRARGCLVGEMAWVKGQRISTISIAPKATSGRSSQFETRWISQPTAKSVQPNDLVCFIKGARAPLIVRPHEDYFSVVLISVPALEEFAIKSERGRQHEHTSPHLLGDVLLVWDWGRSQHSPQVNLRSWDYYGPEIGPDKVPDGEDKDALAKVARLWNTASLYQDAGADDTWAFEKAEEGYGGHLAELFGRMMTTMTEGQIDDSEHRVSVLWASSLACRPLLLSELAVIAGLPHNVNPKTVVQKCSSLLTIKEGKIHLRRQSIREYLERFHQADVVQGHAAIARRSMETISGLERNIHGVDFGLADDVLPPDPDPLSPLRYSRV
jgi:hypothetical protein